MKNNFYIITSCDPYNARHHYADQDVVQRDGATPVRWVEATADTAEEAGRILFGWAKRSALGSQNDGWVYFDDEAVADEARFFKEDIGDDYDASWYQGEGVYAENRQPVCLKGDTSYEDDSCSYTIYSAREMAVCFPDFSDEEGEL